METQVRERPILFSGPMVRAILEGRKSQTRRVVKPQPAGEWAAPGRSKYGKPGDRLWVKEGHWRHLSSPDVRRDRPGDIGGVMYEDEHDDPGLIIGRAYFKRRPSIHMPRWASRITLEIVGVRVERVQDITEADAIAEGVSTDPADYRFVIDGKPAESKFIQASYAFGLLWNQINGKTHPWSSNPWVWVVEFRRV
jgi:hypothetical protein